MGQIETKFTTFLFIAKDLNAKLSITPVLYGSLGLNKYLGEITEIRDIDILVPDEFMGKRWNNLRELMESSGYELVDEKEHEFRKGRNKVAFATEGDLSDIPNFKEADLRLTKHGDVCFRELTPQHYLDLYTWLQTCDYRLNNKAKMEKDKIRVKALKIYLASS